MIFCTINPNLIILRGGGGIGEGGGAWGRG